MTETRIHQLIVGASDGDAITQMALSLQDVLSKFCESHIYSFWNHSVDNHSRFRPLSEFLDNGHTDLLIYHSSIGHPDVHHVLMKQTAPIVLMYHNITPAYFYKKNNPQFAEQLELGRQELKELHSKVRCVIADSYFNAQDIQQYGYRNIEVIPAGFDPYRLCEEPVDAPVIRMLEREFQRGFVLVVGQVLPHKRVEQTIEAVHLLNSTYQLGLGLVICGAQRQYVYAHSLEMHLKTLPFVGVKMTGAVTNQHLATYYKAASVYLSMSDHEGLCIPPTEAMAFGTPVIAKGAGAIPETLGDGALVLPNDAGPILVAEAIYEVLKNDRLRFALQNRGRQQVEKLSRRDNIGEATRILLNLVS